MMMLLSAHPPPPHLIKITCSGEGAERRKCYAGDEDTLLCCITLVLYSILQSDVLHCIPLFSTMHCKWKAQLRFTRILASYSVCNALNLLHSDPLHLIDAGGGRMRKIISPLIHLSSGLIWSFANLRNRIHNVYYRFHNSCSHQLAHQPLWSFGLGNIVSKNTCKSTIGVLEMFWSAP